MEQIDKLAMLLRDTSFNAFLGWALVALLLVLGIVNIADGRFTWSLLIIFLIGVITAPALSLRNMSVMPPWYLIFLAVTPIIATMTAYHFFSTSIPIYLSVAIIAMLLAAEINWFTSMRMNYMFAILLVVTTTLAISGIWYLLHWLLDINFGTVSLLDGRSQEAVNAAVMHEFIYATVAGIAAGVIFGLYFRSSGALNRLAFLSPSLIKKPERAAFRPPAAPVHELLGISERKQRLATWMMQAGLLILLIVSVVIKDLHTALNAIAGLAITFTPSLITRRYGISLDTGLTLWITLAIFMDALGTFAFYDSVPRWDNFTHTLSASVIAAAGYVIIRVIDIHDDEIYVPPKVMFLLIILFVLATGVLWEILEFLTDELTAELGYQAILAQHGINDTMIDMSFNVLGAAFAATWGTAYLSDISYRLAYRFENISATRSTIEVADEHWQADIVPDRLKSKE